MRALAANPVFRKNNVILMRKFPAFAAGQRKEPINCNLPNAGGFMSGIFGVVSEKNCAETLV